MSASNNSDNGESYTRHPAVPMLGAAINAVKMTYKDGDSQQSPKFAVLPQGREAGRVIASGILLDVEDVGGADPYMKASINSGDGETFDVFAGTYQEDEMHRLQELQAPQPVTVVGEIQTYEVEDDDGSTEIKSKVVPEDIFTVSMEEIYTQSVAAAEMLIDDLSSDVPGQVRVAYGDEEIGEIQADLMDAAIASLTQADEFLGGGEEDEQAAEDEPEGDLARDDPITEVNGIGPATAGAFSEVGIKTVGDLMDADIDTVKQADGVGEASAEEFKAAV